MSVREKIYNWLGRKSGGAGGESFGGLSIDVWSRLFGESTYTGKRVDADSALQMSAVWSCVRILSESVGMLPWAIYEKQKNGNSQKVDHDLTSVLVESPNYDMTDVELKEAGVVSLALAGNSYALRETRGDGSLISLYPLCADDVTPQRSENGTISYKYEEDGKCTVYPQEKIWHVKGFGSNGLIGFNPVSVMRQAIGLGLALEEFNARFFRQGARSSGIVKVPNWLEDKQRQQAKKILSEKYEGVENAHKLMLLEGGMEFVSTTMPLEDAQFLQSRGFSVDEICRIYRVPPHMVAKLDRATFASLEQMSMEFAIFTLQPYLTRIERSASKWLFTPKDKGRFCVKFNLDALLRADSKARAEFYASMLQNGVYSRNEVRALENMNQVDGQGMNEYTVQSNMAPLEQLAALVAANSVPRRSVPAKSGDTVVNAAINLPADMKHAIEQRINVPGVLELAEAVKRGHELTRADMQQLSTALLDLKRMLEAPRELLFDNKGEVVGSRLSTQMH